MHYRDQSSKHFYLEKRARTATDSFAQKNYECPFFADHFKLS